MKKLASYRLIDLGIVAVANLLNLIMVPIFLLRTMKVEHPQVVGLVWVVFIPILAVAVVFSIRAKREWWVVLFPLLLGSTTWSLWIGGFNDGSQSA